MNLIRKMKDALHGRSAALLLVLLTVSALLLAGCSNSDYYESSPGELQTVPVITQDGSGRDTKTEERSEEKNSEKQSEEETEKQSEKQTEKQTVKQTEKQTEEETEKQTEKQTEAQTEKQTEKQTEAAIDKNGTYTSKEDVALYIHIYGKLPSNFITKSKAQDLGWPGGGLDGYADGKSIGGDKFSNREGLLPKKKGRTYYECDIDTMHAKSRGAKRIVYSDDGLIYYTEDHYESFTLLYGEE